ncbi:unnamed protein product [Chrysodeixis includens]|uniref:Peptidoglycan-recognition protein n=1 Tax=Chrysodeixis includens TaxID=689277 RepID=A0A9P0BXC7_CHRIL|nr:unnamed protein product [Chrysodeixis includens]
MASFKVIVSVLFLNLSVLALPQSVFRNPSYKLYTRADWDAQPATDVHLLEAPAPYVVIHHTYIPGACHTFAVCSANMRSMQTYHIGIDFGDIGYNFCVGSEGGAYEGRSWDIMGIHAGKANNHSIGICLIGDWREELPPVLQLETTKALIADGVRLGKISPDYKLIGHNQVMATACPGNALAEEISTWEHYSGGRPIFNHKTDVTTTEETEKTTTD